MYSRDAQCICPVPRLLKRVRTLQASSAARLKTSQKRWERPDQARAGPRGAHPHAVAAQQFLPLLAVEAHPRGCPAEGKPQLQTRHQKHKFESSSQKHKFESSSRWLSTEFQAVSRPCPE